MSDKLANQNVHPTEEYNAKEGIGKREQNAITLLSFCNNIDITMQKHRYCTVKA